MRHRWQYTGHTDIGTAEGWSEFQCLQCGTRRWVLSRQALKDMEFGCGRLPLDGWLVA